MKLRSTLTGTITIAVFLIGIGGTMIFNLWRTESSKVPARLSSGSFAGEYDPGDIRGSYSFADISASFHIATDVLMDAFAVDEEMGAEDFQCKILEEIYHAQADGGEVGTDAVRWFVALYTGLPHEPEATTRLPAPAVRFLEDRVDEAMLAEIRFRTLSLGELRNEAAGEGEATVDSEEHDLSGTVGEIKGNTSFGNLWEWGADMEAVADIFGIPVSEIRSLPPGTTLRDYALSLGLEFSSVREALAELF